MRKSPPAALQEVGNRQSVSVVTEAGPAVHRPGNVGLFSNR